MASTRDIRRRIKSVKNTRQITKAMELVAASKMKKAQQAALAGRPYSQLMSRMLAALSARVEESQHPFLVTREVRTRGILLISTDKGLCGPLNSNVFKHVAEVKTPAKFVAVGRKGAQYLARTKRDLVADFPVSDRVAFSEIRVAVEYMVKLYLEGTIDTIEVIYSRFRNTLVQEAMVRPILPLGNLRSFIDTARTSAGAEGEVFADNRDMIFEPDAQTVIDELLVRYVEALVYQAVAENMASEQSARMVAMKSATDNAGSVIAELKLIYNKTRQAAITKELSEIVAGAAAV
jgi:F-type H+-transporting ATPase subunit gamma